MNNNDEVVGVVYKSNNYSKFKLMKGNRDIDDSNVKKLESSIKSIGYKIEEHIIVNEKFEIADGQHRFMACKNLGVPIYYMQGTGLDLKTVKMLNSNQKNWRLKDHVHSNAEVEIDNKDSYVRINNLITKYGISINILQCPALLRCNKNNLKNGTAVFSPEDLINAYKTLDYVFLVIDKCGGRTVVGRSCNIDAFIRTLAYLYHIDNVDNEKLCNASIKYIQSAHPKASNIEQVAEGIEGHYYTTSSRIGRVHFNDYIRSFNTIMNQRVRSEAGKRRYAKSR